MTTTATPEAGARKLPEVLEKHRDAIEKALAAPILGSWPEGEKYHEAAQPEAIGRALVRALYPELANAQIGYLFRQEIHSHRERVWGKASRVAGKVAFYSHLDFLIEISWEDWLLLKPNQRVALIDHELAHCGKEDTEKGERYVLVPHDIEEFSTIARRWGAWRRALAQFANALGDGSQLGLFPHD
jgi:hypothetical protein